MFMPRHWHGYPWPSPASLPYHSSIPAGPQSHIPICTELLYVCFSWSSCICSSIWSGPRSTSLMSSSPHLQKCPARLIRQTWIIFVMGGKWPYSCCFVGCCIQDLFNIAYSILVYLPSNFFSICKSTGRV